MNVSNQPICDFYSIICDVKNSNNTIQSPPWNADSNPPANFKSPYAKPAQAFSP